MSTAGRTAIVAAMAEELQGLLAAMDHAERVVRAGREFRVGTLDGHEVVLVLSRIGKVAAATTATLLLTEFRAERVVFTGVAGGLGPGVHVGDVVVADQLLQHDMDASPLFPRFQVPLYGLDRFSAHGGLSQSLHAAAVRALAALPPPATAWPVPEGAVARAPRIHRGLIVSGDRFVSQRGACAALVAALPEALAVEMEGAALAQVCHDFGTPYAVVRTVSDRADDSAHVDFLRFIEETASRYTEAIVRALLRGA